MGGRTGPERKCDAACGKVGGGDPVGGWAALHGKLEDQPGISQIGSSLEAERALHEA